MKRLSHFTKTAFGVGQVAEGVKNTAFNLFLLFYYSQVLGMPGSRAGLALFCATVLDALSDPLAGSISDRFHHRWGRRHPFMYLSALPLGVTFALLFRPPDGLDESQLFLWLLVFAVLVRASMTLYHVPHLSLGAELSDDYAERTTVVAYRTAFGIAGAMLVVGLAWTVFFRSTPAFPNGQLDPSGYPGFGLLLGAVMTLSVLGSAIGTHDQIPRLPRPAANAGPLRPHVLLRDYRDALSNTSFRALFVGLVIFFVMRGIQQVLDVHMATYFWRLSPDDILATQVGAGLGLVLGVPFWAAAAQRTDKRPAFLVGVSLFSAFVLAPPILAIAGLFPDGDAASYLPLLITAQGLASFCACAGLVTAGSMMADITDEHELATGRRQEGVFFGALAFAVKSTSGLGTFLAGVGLDAIRFPRQALPAEVPPETVTALGVLYGPGIALLAVVGLVVMSGYRIDRRRHAEIAEALAVRRERGAGP